MIRHTLLALCLAAFVPACAATDDLDAEGSSTLEAVSSVTVNSTAIATAPAATLPTVRLARSAFDESAITARLLRSSESLTTVARHGNREVRESSTWHIERDAPAGQILAVRQVAPGPAVAMTDAQLQQAATQRLAEWGLASTEFVRVIQRRTMRQSEEGGVRGAPELHRYKTIFFRGINGVAVEGQRAVVTQSPDGAVHRVLLRWPALASSGHRLRTALTRAQITQRAVEALSAAGETAGSATLRWKYVPTLNAAGETVLTLRVGARMAAVQSASSTEEPREVDVDVSATE